jgi:serine/threonine-protein kinase
MDDVMEVSLAKNPAIRTKSVGELADAVGRAYGLAGDHVQWAKTPQADLARQIAEAAPRAMAPKVAALDVAADPFAAPPPGMGGPPGMGTQAIPQQYAMQMQGRQGMDQAFQATREADMQVAGVPSGKPGWLLPVVVGLLALVVGGAVTLAVMMH